MPEQMTQVPSNSKGTATYTRDRRRVDRALRSAGVVVVMNKDHIKKPEDMIVTVQEVYQAGLVAEVTFRIDEAILREGMQELTRLRGCAPPEKPLVLGVGSVINPSELLSAVEMGFDMIVAPANVMGGYGEGCEFVRTCHEHEVFASPAAFTPTELQYFIERNDGLEPDAVKIFPARSHGPKGLSDLLAPFVRDRHKGRIIMPTGAVDYETGPQYREAIAKRGFFPVLGMSAPLSLVDKEKKPGDPDCIRRSLAEFFAKFKNGVRP
ncbi:MAG TPA: bifunctional 4-hydroxy-2-oxoglutarate aldolase/2-dehydro-3-deoxy-phosphogluconate aldolase [Acidobacteriota bacterium]|nr:bifunctional 4-hydroxy-2-oxoglutarate aldolase/2-dehydro-3-deoxy-phosphogluconate aldolase [Acidobacteriota bacterium]